MEDLDTLNFFDKIRSIAQLGLNYTKDNYDRERYQELLELTSFGYSKISSLPRELIIERFNKELGYITPKVGVNGAVFLEDGKILLERRSDDKLWGFPGGWAEIGETPQESIRRELFEETGLRIEVAGIIDIFSRLPGDYGQPHSSYHILFYCRKYEGDLKFSSESLEVGFFDFKTIKDWHRDHFLMAKKAHEFFLSQAAME